MMIFRKVRSTNPSRELQVNPLTAIARMTKRAASTEAATPAKYSNAASQQVTFTVTTLDARPDLKDAVVELCTRLTSKRPGLNADFGWPIFLYQGQGGLNLFDVVFGFPQYQTLILAHEHGPAAEAEAAAPEGPGTEGSGGAAAATLAAVGYAAPCVWNGKDVEDVPPGWDHVILTAKAMLTDPDNAPRPTAMSALAVEVSPKYQGRGLSQMVLGNMKEVALRLGAKGLLAPIRPILKPQYPLVDMEDYISWRLPDPKRPGQEMMFDPWLRTHLRLGAQVLKVARGSCVVSGSVADWQSWTAMSFLSDGPYTLPGGLVIMTVDRTADMGMYREDNVWVAHSLLTEGVGEAPGGAE